MIRALPWPPWLAGAGVAAAIAVALGIHRGVRGWLPEDWPTAGRKRHGGPVPVAGFLPAAAAVGLAAVLGRPWTAAAIACAGAVGCWDDLLKSRDRGRGLDPGLDWRVKGAGVAAASAAVALGAGVAAGSWPAALGWAALAFVLINATNFLDNTDGVAVALGAVALVAVGGELQWLLAAAWLGFLPFNWPRPWAFLGDAGALALGACLAAAAVERGVEAGRVEPAIAPVAVLLLDFGQVVVARLCLGFAPWIGDRRHLTHIVHHLGLPRVAVAPAFALLAGGVAWLSAP